METHTIVKYQKIHFLVNNIIDFVNSDSEYDFYPLDKGMWLDFIINEANSLKLNKWSLLHCFIYSIEDTLIYHEARNDSKNALLHDDDYQNIVDHYAMLYSIKTEGCKAWILANGINLECADEEDIRAYYDYLDLDGRYRKIIEFVVKEAFFILFNNRKFLFKFNRIVAQKLEYTNIVNLPDEVVALLTKTKRFRRRRIPKWAERAVFFRDRGRCLECDTDLSGTLNITNKQNIDHVIPLEKFGLNDVTNLQLLCDKCNKKKGTSIKSPVERHESWY